MSSSSVSWQQNLLIPRLRLHVLTDHQWSRGRDIVTVAAAALDGGATIIQLRNKTASTRVLIEEGQALRASSYAIRLPAHAYLLRKARLYEH